MAASADEQIEFVAVTAQEGVGSSFTFEGNAHPVIVDPHHQISGSFSDAFGKLQTCFFTEQSSGFGKKQAGLYILLPPGWVYIINEQDHNSQFTIHIRNSTRVLDIVYILHMHTYIYTYTRG